MTVALDVVAALTESVLPRGVAVAARDPRLRPDAPNSVEAQVVSGAVPLRQAEFHAGRAAARSAMVSLGLPPLPVPAGADRAPIWPQGLTGSISHTATACVAALGLADDWAGIGVDLEEDSALDRTLITEICTVSELSWLDTQPLAERARMAKLIFSAKEAVYKAQYPVSGRLFGFDAIAVHIDRANSSFHAVFETPQGAFSKGATLAGSYAHAAGVLVTGVALGQADLRKITG